jgi:hypothetical protein
LRRGWVPGNTAGVRMARVFALLVVGCACATPRGGPGALATIDVVDPAGRTGTLQEHAGKVLALDLCATWAEACHLNARSLDEAAALLADSDARFVTVLMDELPQAAVRAYVDVAHRKVPVVTAGPRTRAGRSVLGDVAGVPRLVVFDRDGHVVVDESGGVLSAEGLVRRLRPLL